MSITHSRLVNVNCQDYFESFGSFLEYIPLPNSSNHHFYLPTLYSASPTLAVCLYIVSAWVDDVLSSLMIRRNGYNRFIVALLVIEQESLDKPKSQRMFSNQKVSNQRSSYSWGESMNHVFLLRFSYCRVSQEYDLDIGKCQFLCLFVLCLSLLIQNLLLHYLLMSIF